MRGAAAAGDLAAPAVRADREGDGVVSGLGGDEFTVLLVALRTDRDAEIVARRIVRCFARPFRLEDHEIYISASIGIAVYPRDVRGVDELLKNADLAMYSAKSHGKNNFQFYTDSMNAEIVHRTTVTSELRKAVEREEFVLHFQPIIDVPTRSIVAVEALVRWRHPTRGLLLPGEFIEIAEESGLIVPIATQVLSAACRQNRAWQESGLPPIRLCVNISGVQLRHAGLRDAVLAVLNESELDPKYLEFEITESAVMADEAEAGRNLTELKALGLRIALDDFGTGYSSLSYVRRFPVDSLKIDRSFVHGVATDLEAQAITRAIVAMAHGLNLRVVAEGVETEAQEQFLVGLGCDEFQGFRFGRPQPAAEITRLLARRFGIEEARPGSPSGA
jgi:predicted signal transduction protein with EAL and GGDEF domain